MNIAIIENNKLYRESLRTVLNQINDFNVVYEGYDLHEVTHLPDIKNLNIILMDYNIVEGRWDQIIEQTEKLSAGTKIIIISDFNEICYLENLKSKGITDVINKNAGKKDKCPCVCRRRRNI